MFSFRLARFTGCIPLIVSKLLWKHSERFRIARNAFVSGEMIAYRGSKGSARPKSFRKLGKRALALKDERIERLQWLPGKCKIGICGEEAACIPDKDLRHKCVCPSDLSAPTEDLQCPTRRIVPFTPRPILNINISGGSIKIPRNDTPNQGHEHLESEHINQTEKVNPSKNEIASDSGLVIGLFGLACFVLFAGAAFWWRRTLISKCAMKTNLRKHDANPSPLSLSKGLLRSYVPNPQYTTADSISAAILPREALSFKQEIGEGCFGKVFKGELQREDGTKETVAIKVLKDSASKQAEEDFMREVEIMSSFRHSNILSLIGIVLKEPGARPWMVFEFMPHGDLAEVLRRNSRQLWKPVPGLKPLTKRCLLRIALQISGGMRYLAGQRFVHNDLACRNCLVGSELTVKIADFGMSRDIYTCDYYRIGGSKPVPLRWMSPESVMYRRFTLESDIWSYGVVLWEIYSLGKQPYYGLNNEEVIKMILQGVLLVPPEGCPQFVSDLMKACWKLEPKDRMKFTEIYGRLKKALKDKEHEKPNETSEQETFSGLTSCDGSSGISLPRPPVYPVSHVQSEEAELLDSENYLAPQTALVNEYLQPIPD